MAVYFKPYWEMFSCTAALKCQSALNKKKFPKRWLTKKSYLRICNKQNRLQRVPGCTCIRKNQVCLCRRHSDHSNESSYSIHWDLMTKQKSHWELYYLWHSEKQSTCLRMVCSPSWKQWNKFKFEFSVFIKSCILNGPAKSSGVLTLGIPLIPILVPHFPMIITLSLSSQISRTIL